ncbi:hypothetical protein F5884DRAFT_802263 [Xylogone sp. PMI_703]|nr:hypothetical protein F5884DRAFT_802263 [Xylogone sp. PMI_703]
MSNAGAVRRRHDREDEIVDNILNSLDLRLPSNNQQLVEQRAVFRKGSEIQDALHAEDFKLAMQEFRRISTQPDGRLKIESDLKTAISWEDVLLVAENAVDEYNKKAQNGAYGFLRRIGRGFGEHAPTVKAVMKMVPQSDFTEPLLGVFDFIIEAAVLLRERSNQIDEILNELPDTLQLVAYARETYPTHEKLAAKTQKLYAAILGAVERMAIYLRQPPGSKLFKAALKGTSFEKELVNDLENIKTYFNQISNLAAALDRKLGAQTYKVAQGLERGAASNSHKLEYIVTRINGFSENYQTTTQEFRGLLKEIIRKSDWGGSRVIRTVNPLPKQAITSEDLRRLLAIEPSLNESEIDVILGHESGESDPSQGLLSGIPHDKKFQHWLSTNESDLLFVQDNMASLELKRVSALSIFCANLTRNLREDHAVISIQFFCGNHDTPGNDSSLSGAAGLIKSLIFQLIRTSGYVSFDLGFLSPSKVRSNIDRADIATLTWVFEQLVKQLPLDTVLFCFVDGLSFFERQVHRDETMEVIDCLQRIVKDQSLPSVFKLLLTHLTSNGHRQYYINPRSCLFLSRQVEFDGYDLTEREIAARVRRVGMNDKATVEEAYDFSGSEEDEAEQWNGDLLHD